jgi:hypothetical protein
MNAKSVLAISRRRLLALSLLALVLGLAQVGSAQAEVVLNDEVPVSGDITNPCTGTTDFVEGTAQFQVRTTLSPSGQDHIGVHIVLFFQGDVLTIISVHNEYLNADLRDGRPAILTFVAWAKFIERGAAADGYIKNMLHLTINANGDETSMRMEFSDTECRG